MANQQLRRMQHAAALGIYLRQTMEDRCPGMNWTVDENKRKASTEEIHFTVTLRQPTKGWGAMTEDQCDA